MAIPELAAAMMDKLDLPTRMPETVNRVDKYFCKKTEENREYKSFTGFKRIVRGKFDYAQLNSWLNRHIKTCLYVDTEMLHVNRIINVNSEFVKILGYRQHCSKIQSKDNPKMAFYIFKFAKFIANSFKTCCAM